MGKPRDLANVVATGNILADGAVAPAELTGVTSTAAEINILDGVTATAAELNLMDGVTATTAELNYVDGVTSNVQTQMDTKAPVAGPTFTGTLAAPTINASTALQIGGAAITATAAELNIMDGVTASTLDINGVAGINSNVQTQLNLKAPIDGATFTGTTTIPTADINGGAIDGAAIGANSASTGAFSTGSFTGDVSIADKIVHTSDTNTAIRFPADDTVSFETGGSERFRFASAGQLGIGGATYGTAGQVLSSGGASAAPTWADAGGGAYELIQKQTISSAVSAVTFTTTTAPQEQLILILNGVRLNSQGFVCVFFKDSSGNLLTSDGNGDGYYEQGTQYNTSAGNGNVAEDNFARTQLNGGVYSSHLYDFHSQVNIFGWGTTTPYFYAQTISTNNNDPRVMHFKLGARFRDRSGGTVVPAQIELRTQVASSLTAGDVYLYKLV